MIVLLILLILFVVLFLVYCSFPFITICGESMYPTYKDGEIICSTRLFRRSSLKEGDVLIFKREDLYVIKRVGEIYKDEKGKVLAIYFLGDNPPQSYDSRVYGFIPVGQVVSKVINPRVKEDFQDEIQYY